MNKLKIGIGICSSILGIALINNVQSETVHADAINWDNQNAEGNVVSADNIAKQSTNDIKISNVQSTRDAQQNYAGALATPRISNVQAGQINKTKIAQFNSNSKIYGLNNSDTLSKNNGDGYVITNAGTYDGKQVDIGVTINNVNSTQGSYTTKWSNGDKAADTGKTDTNFEYQNSILTNKNSVAIAVPTKQRTRSVTVPASNYLSDYYARVTWFGEYPAVEYVSPKLVNDVMKAHHLDEYSAVKLCIDTANDISYMWKDTPVKMKPDDYVIPNVKNGENGFLVTEVYSKNGKTWGGENENGNDDFGNEYLYHILVDPAKAKPNTLWSPLQNRVDPNKVTVYSLVEDTKFDATRESFYEGEPDEYGDVRDRTGARNIVINDAESGIFDNKSDRNGITDLTKDRDPNKFEDYTFGLGSTTAPSVPESVKNVTDHLQIDQIKNGNLSYDYTIGLYDAQTGDLITSLKPEYKNGVKVGKEATNQDTVMNNAIKNKIADINANKAAVAFNGTAANDDVAFYQETTPVQDVSKLTAIASRTITLHFPNNRRPASYDNLVNNNNQIVQTLKFTRTGTTDLVTGQTTYTPWTGDSKFPDVKLPKLPGFKLQIS